MSQIEQTFRQYLTKHPEISTCYGHGLINRRGLARFLIKQGVVPHNQLDATIAMLRRFDFSPFTQEIDFKILQMALKDNLKIISFEKSKENAMLIAQLFEQTAFNQGQTLKVVAGTSHITAIVDESRDIGKHEFKKNITEISLTFDTKIISSHGIIATLTNYLSLFGIILCEIMTSQQELLLYVDSKQAAKAYQVLKEFN